MALQKSFTKTRAFSCELQSLKAAVYKAIETLNLKTKNSEFDDDKAHIVAVEKLSWLSSNWPVEYEITLQAESKSVRLNVSCKGKMMSITQDNHRNSLIWYRSSGIFKRLMLSVISQTTMNWIRSRDLPYFVMRAC